VDSTGHFAYVANYGSADISAYRIDQESGALAPISGSPISVGGAASSVAGDLDAHFVYVAVDLGSGPSQVSGFSIDEKSGDLTPVPGSPSPTEHFPFSITVDPTGNFVYVTCGARATGNPDPTISAYTIDRKTGALTQVSDSPYGVGFPPISVTVDPTGQFVYVADFLTQSISSFTIDRDNGALTQMLAVPVSGEPRSVATDPSGKFLYVAAFGALGVPSYTINQLTGTLTLNAGMSSPTGIGPNSIVTTAGPSSCGPDRPVGQTGTIPPGQRLMPGKRCGRWK
jgi:6-phosphogluconolactonase (cycloisomerase 2 family)